MTIHEHEGQEVIAYVERRGHDISGRIHFYTCTKEKIKDLASLQSKLGYSPCGYDGPWTKSIEEVKGKFITHWTCSASCD